MARSGTWEVVSELRARIPRTFEFSATELAVLRMLANGQDDREISRTLRIEPPELKSICLDLARRLRVPGRRKLVSAAQDLALSEF
ncbi:MAG: LuxR C-terminal-related transcriptional regulator [Dehalococcoidia bacterium]